MVDQNECSTSRMVETSHVKLDWEKRDKCYSRPEPLKLESGLSDARRLIHLCALGCNKIKSQSLADKR